MKVVDIAAAIFRELGEPSDTSISPIAYWLRTNIGLLNTATYKQYFVDASTLEIKCQDPNNEASFEEIGDDEVAIFKLLYVVHYYDLQIRKNNLNYSTRVPLEVTSDGHTVRLVSPTEIGRSLYMFRKNLSDDLMRWINWYRLARSTPRQVAGDDTMEAIAYDRPLYPRTVYSV